MQKKLWLLVSLLALLIAPARADQGGIGMYTTVCESDADTIALIAKCKAAGVGTLYPSLCGGSTVLWKTDKEDYYPSYRERMNNGYDALAVFIKHAHANGIKVYPSVVCGFGGRILNGHPDWET